MHCFDFAKDKHLVICTKKAGEKRMIVYVLKNNWNSTRKNTPGFLG